MTEDHTADRDGGAAEQARAQLERLTFFSDAVFAIAMTLLVVEVRLPPLPALSDQALGQALVDLFTDYIGFVSSFIVIARFWVGHHELFGLLKASDGRLVWTNMFLLMVVAFMPFPTAIFSKYVQLRVGVGFYTGWLTLIGIMTVLSTRAAVGGRRLLRDGVDDAQIRRRLRGSWIAVFIGAAAFAAGMVAPLLALVVLVAGSPLISLLVRRWGERRAVRRG